MCHRWLIFSQFSADIWMNYYEWGTYLGMPIQASHYCMAILYSILKLLLRTYHDTLFKDTVDIISVTNIFHTIYCT